jgi:hypothetical protein
MSPMSQSSVLSLRISETEPAATSQAYDAFAAAMLDAADEYTPDAPSSPRTLGRTTAERREESSPASIRRDKKLEAAERKLQIARLKLEAEQRKLDQKAAAKQAEEEAAEAKRQEKERAAAQRRAEKASRRSGGLFSWLRSRRVFAEKQLRVSESLSLGEKRFVAILHAEGRKFLIGGGASGVLLLTALEPAQTSANAADLIHLVPGAAERS